MLRYAQIARRYKAVIVLTIALVVGTAAAISLTQRKLYAASAEVLLQYQSNPTILGLGQTNSVVQDPVRLAETQARLARAPVVAAHVLQNLRLPQSGTSAFLSNASVSVESGADVLRFEHRSRKSRLAVRLVNLHARAYIAYQQVVAAQGLAQTHRRIQRQLDQLARGGLKGSALFAKLSALDQDVTAAEAFRVPSAVLIRPATTASVVRPRLVRNLLLAIVLGCVLAVVFAMLFDVTDTRIRSFRDVTNLGLPLLGRAPEARWHPWRRVRFAVLDAPTSREAEAFRTLGTSMQLAIAGNAPDVATVMATSAVREDNKASAIANLGAALAVAGMDVILVDLDSRSRGLSKAFGLESRLGVTDVVSNRVELGSAVLTIPQIASRVLPAAAAGEENRHRLRVLPAGTAFSSDSQFSANRQIGELLTRLARSADLILVDAPPLLEGAVAMALSARVDALVVLARPQSLRPAVLEESRRVLDMCPCAKLGLVAIGEGL